MKLRLTFVYLLAAVGVLMLAIYLTVVLLNSRSAKRNARRTSSAVATITDTRSNFTSYSNQSLSVKYKYAVDGKSYQGETLKETNVSWDPFVVGKTAKACYDPDDPAGSAVWPLNFICEQ